MSSEKFHVKGVLLVGSVPGNDTEDVLRRIAPALGSRLKYIPDGETGQRNFFIGWQMYKVCILSESRLLDLELTNFTHTSSVPFPK
jgi:hypothetical protein